MDKYTQLQKKLKSKQGKWLVTGVAGFIGSNLLERLLKLEQNVIGLDNFSTGHKKNLELIKANINEENWKRFEFIEGDISDFNTCLQVTRNVDYVLHQAAIGSVPRSIEDPLTTNRANIDGFINMLLAAKESEVKSFVYAASSSTYGDHPALPKKEENIGTPLSPYAVTKYVNELYANVFDISYGFKTIGLRYFNVFGKRQDPDGAYAAVIPRWISAMIKQDKVFINGDGETSRDFCYIENVVQINLLAATTDNPEAVNQVYNVAVGDQNTLNQLYEALRVNLAELYPHLVEAKPIYRDFREGDVRHSLADISKSKSLLGYAPQYRIGEGLKEAMTWYMENN